jgi:hypothetical protein
MNKNITRKGVACYAPTFTAILGVAITFTLSTAFAANLPKNCTDEIVAISKGSGFSMSQFASDLPVAVVKAKAQAKLPFGKPKDSEKTSIGMTFGCLKVFPESPGEILSLLKDVGLEGAKGAVAGQTNGLANPVSGATSSATPFATTVAATASVVVNMNLAVIETEMDAELAATKELTASELSYMTKEIRRLAINNLQNHSIMTEQSVKAQGDVDSQTCRDETCMFSFGKKIGADFIIIGTVSKFRKNYAFTVEVYDAGTGKLVLSSDPVENENVENLLSGFREIAPAFFKSLESRLSGKGNRKEQVRKYQQQAQPQYQYPPQQPPQQHIQSTAFAANLPKDCTEELIGILEEDDFDMQDFIEELVPAVAKARIKAKSPFGKPKDSEEMDIGLTFGCLKSFPQSPADIQSLLKDVVSLKASKNATTNQLDANVQGIPHAQPPYYYPPPQAQAEQEEQPENFTGGQRFATWFLNTIIPIGSGSAMIMDDYAGMGIQMGLNVLGVISIAVLGFESYSNRSCGSYYNGYCRDYDTHEGTRTTAFFPIGIGLLGTSALYNIIRSASYDKPTENIASKEHSGFNLAILPNEHGKFIPHVMYNKAF